MFGRSIGGAVGVSVMGAILAAGLGGSVHDVPAALDSGIGALSPEVRQHFIAALQQAFYGAAVAAGLAVIVAFWVPPFEASATEDEGEPVLLAEM
jgi:hypothetical protein